jgi:hypothetical protein
VNYIGHLVLLTTLIRRIRWAVYVAGMVKQKKSTIWFRKSFVKCPFGRPRCRWVITSWGWAVDSTTSGQCLVPNLVVEWLTLLFLILEVSASNLCPESGYPDCFRDFPQSIEANAGVVPERGHYRFLPHPFQLTIHLSPFHSMICSLSYWKASLNKLQVLTRVSNGGLACY